MNYRFKFIHLIYLLLAAAFIYALVAYRDQLLEIWTVTRQGIWYLVLLAVALLFVSVVNQALLYANIYDLLDIPSQRRQFLPLYLSRRFVTVAAPSGGFSGWLPFLHFARRNGLGVGAVFVANLVYTVLWYSTFGLFLFAGLLALFISHDLQWFEISAALVMMVADLLMIVILIVGWFRPDALERVLHRFAALVKRLFERLKRKPPVTDWQLMAFFDDLMAAIVQIRKVGRRRLTQPVGYALANELLNVTILFVVGLAFGVQLAWGVLVAAYAASILFFVVSPTPGGLGFVEGTVILILTALGVRAHNATVITLVYRGITFWLPFVLGFPAIRWVNSHVAQEPLAD